MPLIQHPIGISMIISAKKLVNLTMFFSLILCTSFANSQNSPEQAGKSFEAVRIDQAPQIDGDLSDSAWAQAAHIDDFLQSQPLEYRTASERTEVYVMYDENALYFGFYAHDSKPNEITANVLQQGTTTRFDDRVGVIIDPFNMQRGGYTFQLNPHGVRLEGIYINGNRGSFNWEGLWNGAAKQLEDGWSAEFEIPFKSLSFDPDNDTWGVNFSRNLQRNQENMAWYSRNGSANPTNSGKMTGISQITQGVGLDVVPALSGNSFEDKVAGTLISNVQPSVDIFYKVTPQINLAVTLNTDFSATEADTNTLNSSRFRRFFAEKRAFFLNDFDTFKFGLTDLRYNGSSSGNNALAFYSRRIGLSEDGQPVDIVGGIKLSGRSGETEFGALVMRQDETTVTSGGVTEIIDPTNAIVARVSRSVFSESKIGLIFTDGNPAENQSNSLYGVDFHYRDTEFYAGKSLNAVMVYQQSQDPDFSDNQRSYSAAFTVGSNEGWYGGAQYFAVEENYSPGLGFTQRTNAELISGSLSYKWLFEGSFIEQISTNLSTTNWNDLDTGVVDYNQISWTPFNIKLRRGDSLNFSFEEKTRVARAEERPTGDLGIAVPLGEYSNSNYEFRYSTPSYLDLSGQINMEFGDYYDGTFTTTRPTISWQANRHFLFSTSYQLTKYEMPSETVFAREVEFDLNIAFNSKVSLTSTIEYDNIRRQASFNNRLRWNIEPGQDLWVVFNQGLVDQDEDYNFAVETTSAAFKLRYTLRF
jgi:hypothetical protein|tara:strand:- start:2378 stop:4642 length:2265 start_codon:yes stop_codon:yes gene_type:complete